MSANPAMMGGAQSTLGARGGRIGVPIPARWRTGQIVVTALILVLAIWYNLAGYKSHAGESGLADAVSLYDQVGFLLLIALTWLTTPIAGTIAMTTWQEAVRRRWMSALLAFALVLIGLSTFFTWMQPGTEQKFLRDFGLGFTIIITMLMAIFLGVALVPPEIERRTIFTILSKPVNRGEFLIGKFLGLCLTLLVNLAVMSLMFLLSYIWFTVRRDPNGLAGALQAMPQTGHPGLMFELGNLSRALILHFGQLAIMAALALTMSLIVSNIAAIVLCFVVYFFGQASSYWEHLAGESGAASGSRGLSGPIQTVVKTIYFIIPRLDRFDVRERLVNDMPVAFNYMWRAFGSGLMYVALLLTVAYWIFSDREF